MTTAFEEADKKSFDFAVDASKQVVTLSTAVVGLTITFFKDFAGDNHPDAEALMPWAWGLLLTSLLAGLIHIYALTGALAGSSPYTIRDAWMMVSAALQQFLFLAGMIVVVIAGAMAL